MTVAGQAARKRPAAPRAEPRAPDPGALLAWYDRHRRDLPWRARPGEAADPYRVWLSEIMLQQTTVKAVAQHGGRFPDTEDALRALPGVGPYTAAAIAAIAFDRRASPVDGNVERVIARLHAVEEELPGAKPRIRRLAETLTPERRAGDFAQAMMDLGATIC